MEAQSCTLMFVEILGSARTRAAPNPNTLRWYGDLPIKANYCPTLICRPRAPGCGRVWKLRRALLNTRYFCHLLGSYTRTARPVHVLCRDDDTMRNHAEEREHFCEASTGRKDITTTSSQGYCTPQVTRLLRLCPGQACSSQSSREPNHRSLVTIPK